MFRPELTLRRRHRPTHASFRSSCAGTPACEEALALPAFRSAVESTTRGARELSAASVASSSIRPIPFPRCAGSTTRSWNIPPGRAAPCSRYPRGWRSVAEHFAAYFGDEDDAVGFRSWSARKAAYRVSIRGGRRRSAQGRTRWQPTGARRAVRGRQVLRPGRANDNLRQAACCALTGRRLRKAETDVLLMMRRHVFRFRKFEAGPTPMPVLAESATRSARAHEQLLPRRL